MNRIRKLLELLKINKLKPASPSHSIASKNIPELPTYYIPQTGIFISDIPDKDYRLSKIIDLEKEDGSFHRWSRFRPGDGYVRY